MAARAQAVVFVAALAVGTAFCGGCKGAPGEAAGAWYRIDAAAVTLAPGASGAVAIRFVPKDGYHWNPEFPARLKVSDAGTVAAERLDFSNSGGDFKDDGGTGVVSVPVAARSVGPTALKGQADFSVCNAKECRIFKAVAVEVPIDVH